MKITNSKELQSILLAALCSSLYLVLFNNGLSNHANGGILTGFYKGIYGLFMIASFSYFAFNLILSFNKLDASTIKWRLFYIAFLIRLTWVIVSYLFSIFSSCIPFGIGSEIYAGYHEEACFLSEFLKMGEFNKFFRCIKSVGDFSDSGYPICLSIIYSITLNSILIAEIFKSIIGAYTCVLIYNLSIGSIGDKVARTAAILYAFLPNVIFYTGVINKNIELVFILVLLFERAQTVINSREHRIINSLIVISLCVLLLFFRTTLAIASVSSILSSVVMCAMVYVVSLVSNESNVKIVNTGLLLGGLALAVIFKAGDLFLLVIFYFILKKNLRNKRFALITTFIYFHIKILMQSTYFISNDFNQPVYPFLIVIIAYLLSMVDHRLSQRLIKSKA